MRVTCFNAHCIVRAVYCEFAAIYSPQVGAAFVGNCCAMAWMHPIVVSNSAVLL